VKIEDFLKSGAGAPLPALGVPAPESSDGWVLPVEHLSVSAMNKFLMCERVYQRHYILGEKAPANHKMVAGSAVHGAIAWAALHPDMNADEAAGYLREFEWPNQVEDNGGVAEIEWHDKNPEELAAKAAQMVSVYVAEVVPRLEVDEVEKRFELDLPGVPVPIIGFIDYTQKGTRPAIDIKTRYGSTRPSSASKTVLPGWLLQGRIYQLSERKDVDWHQITDQATPQAVTSLQYPDLLQHYSEIQCERTVEIVERIAWRINETYAALGPDEDWAWTGTWHTYACNGCHWRGSCPGWEGS
jgi:hypothetical protein